MSNPKGTRRAIAEIRWNDDPGAILWVGNRPVPTCWPLLSAYFRDLLLPPHHRAEDEAVTWMWNEPVNPPALTLSEINAVRRSLQRELQRFMENISGSDRTPRQSADSNPVDREQLGLTLREWVQQVVDRPDAELARYVCRTDQGLRLHSWGASQASGVRFSDAKGLELAGHVLVGGMPALHDVLLETGDGEMLAETPSNSLGAFRFSKLTPGKYRLRARSKRGTFPPHGLVVLLNQASVTDIVLADDGPAAATARGRRPARAGTQRALALAALVAVLMAGAGWWVLNRTIESNTPEATAVVAPRSQPAETPRPPTAGSVGLTPRAQETAVNFNPPASPANVAAKTPVPSVATVSDFAQTHESTRTGQSQEASGSGVAVAGPTGGGGAIASPAGGVSSRPSGSSSAAALSTTTPPTANPTLLLPPPASGERAPDSAVEAGKTNLTTAVATSGEANPTDRSAAPEADASHAEKNRSSATASVLPSSASENVAATPPPAPSTRDAVREQPAPSDPSRTGQTTVNPPTINSPSVAWRAAASRLTRTVRVRLSPWRVRLLEDAILPTQPLRAGQVEPVAVLRQRILEEQKAKLPATLTQGEVLSGLRIELAKNDVYDGLAWRNDAGAVIAGSRVENGRAEITWAAANAPVDRPIRLSGGNGVVLVEARYEPSTRELVVRTAEDVQAWLRWVVRAVPIAGRDSTGETSIGKPRFVWKTGTGNPVPTGWHATDSADASADHRVDLPLGSVFGSVAGQSCALLDQETGWALVTETRQAADRPLGL